MRETESRLKMCEDKLLVLRSPQLPDLERVHATIDQCQVRSPHPSNLKLCHYFNTSVVYYVLLVKVMGITLLNG